MFLDQEHRKDGRLCTGCTQGNQAHMQDALEFAEGKTAERREKKQEREMNI